MVAALDVALDDVIKESWTSSSGGKKGSWGKGKSWGKGGTSNWGGDAWSSKGDSWSSWSKGRDGDSWSSKGGSWKGGGCDGERKRDSSWSGGGGASPGGKEDRDSSSGGKKLDMSLDEVIDSSKGDYKGGKSAKGKGKDKDSKGRSWGKGKDSKGWSWGAGYKGSPWIEHDDWRSEGEATYGGSYDKGEYADEEWSSRREDGGGWKRADRDSRSGGCGFSWGSPAKRSRAGAADDLAKCVRIKVTNVPRTLKARDIREAFEAEAGRTNRCELVNNVAWIHFYSAEDARKAVETFDRGELNGKTITVTLEH